MATAEMEKCYWQLHHIISKSRTIARLLLQTFEEMGYQEPLAQSKELEQLLTWITTSAKEKAKLDDQIQYNHKKLSMKSFKHSVANLIEEGRLGEWILQVKEEELKNTGGEVNRLYQLLTEGKKANSLLLDSASLQNAATRADLFSVKQCQVLEERASDLEARMVEETERLLQLQAEKEAAEKDRQELLRRAQVGIPLRTTVVLQGLKKRPDLNGATGIYMGLASNDDRYIVRVGGVDMAFLKTNFRKYEGPPPSSQSTVATKAASWSCPHSTVVHEGHDAMQKECSRCGHSRTTATPSAASKLKGQRATDQQRPAKAPAPTAPQKTLASAPPVATNKPAAKPPTKTQQTQERTTKAAPAAAGKAPLPVRKITMWIPVSTVPAFIGRNGSNVIKIRKESGAKVRVDKKKTNGRGSCAVYVEGTQAQRPLPPPRTATSSCWRTCSDAP